MPVAPITPKEASAGNHIPDLVISTVNRLLAARGGSRRIVLKQKDILAELESQGMDRQEIFYQCWLDFEPLYEKAGWEVEYNKPCAGEEPFDAYYVFTK